MSGVGEGRRGAARPHLPRAGPKGAGAEQGPAEGREPRRPGSGVRGGGAGPRASGLLSGSSGSAPPPRLHGLPTESPLLRPKLSEEPVDDEGPQQDEEQRGAREPAGPGPVLGPLLRGGRQAL